MSGWGVPRGIDDLVARVRANEAALTSLCLLPTRTVSDVDAASLGDAIAVNDVLLELRMSGHKLGARGLAGLAVSAGRNGVFVSISLRSACWLVRRVYSIEPR